MNSCVRALVADASLDHRHDPGDHRVRCRPADAHPQRARAVQGPGEHLVAGHLGDGQRLAGDRGLVHLAGPVQDLAVRADPLPGADQHHVPDPQAGRLDDFLGSVIAEPDGLVRGQVEQAAHRLRGAVGGHRLQRAGGREDDDQQAAVQDLPDRRGGDRGRDHQQVHVQRPGPQRAQPGPARLPAPGRVAGQEQRPGQPPRAAAEVRGQAGREQCGRRRGPAHLGQRPQARTPRRGQRRGAGAVVTGSSRLAGTGPPPGRETA